MPELTNLTGPGRIVYLMGASGAGKDSLIRYAEKYFPGHRNFTITSRYITREVHGDSHHDQAIDEKEFHQRLRNDFFAFHWESYGYYYGISRQELDESLARGLNCIVNGSRRYHTIARRLYPDLVTVLVRADPGLRWLRLELRRRDDPGELATRLKNSDNIFNLETKKLPHCHVIDNNGPLEAAGEKFISILRRV